MTCPWGWCRRDRLSALDKAGLGVGARWKSTSSPWMIADVRGIDFRTSGKFFHSPFSFSHDSSMINQVGREENG